MLFNSLEFIYAYFPVVLGIFLFIGARSHRPVAMWLIAASLFLYGWWNPRYLVLLLFSFLVNHRLGIKLAREYERPPSQRRILLLDFSVGGNRALLAYYVCNLNFLPDCALECDNGITAQVSQGKTHQFEDKDQ